MAQFQVSLKKVVDDSYEIDINRNLFPTLIADLKAGLMPKASKYALITDSNVKELYGDKLYSDLKAAGFNVYLYSFLAGEASKSRETKISLEDQMLADGFGRDSAIIALGGGVVSDLAGFLAGTFGRGIPFVTYSTTFLSAADASVGGKTAVDTPVATNLIGLFNQPVKVYIDIDTWNTLPVREVACGMAETIKHACLADAEFFVYLEENYAKVLTGGKAILDKEVCEHIAYKNCQIKYQVVQADEKEANYRQVLNLGHTGGRALEALCDFKLLHGECVSVGMMIQAAMGVELGFMSQNDYDRLEALQRNSALPVEVPDYMPSRTMVEKMYTDKKVRSGNLRFVFQDGIGAMKVFNEGDYSLRVEDDFIFETLEKMRK